MIAGLAQHVSRCIIVRWCSRSAESDSDCAPRPGIAPSSELAAGTARTEAYFDAYLDPVSLIRPAGDSGATWTGLRAIIGAALPPSPSATSVSRGRSGKLAAGADRFLELTHLSLINRAVYARRGIGGPDSHRR